MQRKQEKQKGPTNGTTVCFNLNLSTASQGIKEVDDCFESKKDCWRMNFVSPIWGWEFWKHMECLIKEKSYKIGRFWEVEIYGGGGEMVNLSVGNLWEGEMEGGGGPGEMVNLALARLWERKIGRIGYCEKVRWILVEWRWSTWPLEPCERGRLWEVDIVRRWDGWWLRGEGQPAAWTFLRREGCGKWILREGEMDGGGGDMVNLALGAGEVVSLTPSGREVRFLKSAKL